jgi:hypothetical protein
MPEPENAVDFFNNYSTQPKTDVPKNNEPVSTVDFFNNYGKKPLTKQDVNLAMQDAPVYLNNNEEFTLDPSKYETKYQLEFTDAVNNFRQGIDETQKSANEYDISAAKLKIANNNKLLQTLNPNDPARNELLRDNDNQIKEIESATEDKIANQKEIDNEYVSKKYKLNEALVQGQGSEAGFFDKLEYTMPSMLGSSMSLIVPNLLATFATKAGATAATAALAKAGVKGSKSNWMGGVFAVTGAIGGIALGRHLESKSEVGGQITANEDALSQEYIDNVYNQTGQEITKDQIPQDAMDDIIIQANKGREELYYKNMMLATTDVGEALLFSPKLNLFGANKLSKAVNKAIDYNKYTRLGTKAAKFGAVYESEKFEEGAQYAFGKRQEDFALNSGEYEDKGFVKNLLTDSKDVLSSMNFSPIGEVRGSGRYADDKQFQTAEESGGMLAALMGGIQTTTKVAKDLNTYRKVNKELQDDGVFNVDANYFKLKDQILQKHFENGTTHHLLEGVKNLIGKKNEDGTEILTKEQAKEEVDKVQKAFDTYQTVESQVNQVEKKGAFLMFDSAEQKVAKKAVKDNLFHTSLQLAREQKDLTDLTVKRNNVQNVINDPKLKNYNNINDLIEKQKDVVEKLKAFDPMGTKESFNIPFRLKANEEKLKQLEEIKKAEETKLKEAGVDIKIEPLTIAEQDLNKQIIAKESLLQEQTDNYKELLKIKDDKSLQEWYSKYNKNKNTIRENADAAEAKKAHTDETKVTDFSEFEDEENAPAEDTRWYKDITDRKELDNILQQGKSSGQITQADEDAIVSDWEAIQATKAVSKTDWNNIINNAANGDELKKIIDQIDADVDTQMTPELLDTIAKKRATFTKTEVTENEVIEKLSNGITNSFDDNLNTDEVLESNNTNNETSNKEFVSKKPNALMMKFYDFVSGTKKWARHTKKELLGYVMEASSAEVSIDESNIQVSIDVNSPTVAIEGSEVAYVHNGKDIALVDANGKIVGFLGLGTNEPGPKAGLDVIVAYKELMAIREYVLSKPSGTLKTTILVKGHGKLLTKMAGNLPILDQPVSQRTEDMIEGRPLFLYDDGVGLTSKNLTEAQSKVAEQFKNISFSEGRVYQAVKTANGTWFVIPVYTKLIGEVSNSKEVIDNIISILKGAIVDGKTIDYNKALQQLNKYIFATNTTNYKTNLQALRIYEDKDHVENGTVKVGVVKLTFNDILTGNKIDELRKAISEVRHNLSANELGKSEEDSKLINNDVLVTNAYTDSTGQYYVQPYIEVNNPEGYVKPEIKVEPISATTATNISPVVTTTTFTDEKQIAKLRADEQADLVKAKINLAKFKDTYGENQGDMPDALYAIYKPIYDKYNKLITDVSEVKPTTDAKADVKLSSTDKIIWGHPGLGKTTFREQNPNKVLDFDTDFKPKVAKLLGLPKDKQNSKGLNEWRNDLNETAFETAMRQVWKEAVAEAKKTGKMLVVSDMMFLRENAKDFDKIITLDKETFIKRTTERGDDVTKLESWKSSIDKTIAALDQNKVISTGKYFSEITSSTDAKADTTDLETQKEEYAKIDEIFKNGKNGLYQSPKTSKNKKYADNSSKGWKLHIQFKKGEVVKVAKFLYDNNLYFKAHNDGGTYFNSMANDGATIYIGSSEDALKISNLIKNNLGDILEENKSTQTFNIVDKNESIYSGSGSDITFSKGMGLRFDVAKTKHGWLGEKVGDERVTDKKYSEHGADSWFGKKNAGVPILNKDAQEFSKLSDKIKEGTTKGLTLEEWKKLYARALDIINESKKEAEKDFGKDFLGIDNIINAKYDAELTALKVKPAETTKQEIITPAKPKRDINKIDVTGDDFAESKTQLGGEAVNQASLKALNKILPGLSIANAKLAEEVGKNMKDTYGMFHNMLIYLFNGATNRTLFHEAFHGVFRNMLSDEERRAILNEAIKKYDKPNAARLQFLRKGKGNANLSDEILTQLHYEERLADDFGKHADGVFNPSLGQKIINFFNKIVDLFGVFKNANKDQITKLFEEVTKGKFAKRSIDAKLANKAINLEDFGGAYSRYLNTDNLNIPLSVELERTNSIANQLLDGISKELAKGTPMSEIKKKKVNEIASKIRAQYKLVWETEDAKSDDELNGPLLKIAYGVDLKFEGMLLNAKKLIKLTRKLNLDGDFVDTAETEGSEDVTKDSENIDNMQGNESKGFQEQTTISGIRSATQDIKLFLSNIPVISKQGVVQIDSYGFTIYHSYEKLYYKLETSLVGTTSFVEQMKIMKELAPYSTEMKQIIEAIEKITNPQIAKNFKQQFASNFNKQVLNYKLVTYAKSKLGYIFKMLDPNRKDVALNLKTKWTADNITDPTNLATSDIRTFNEDLAVYQVSKNKVSALLDSYWSKGEKTKSGTILVPKLTIDEVYELAQKLGIGLSFDSIELYASLKEENLKNLTRDLLNYGDLMYVKNKFTPARNVLNNLIKLEINAQTELFTSSFNNVENSVVYAVQHQSFASKLVKALNSKEIASDNLVKELQRDPMNFNNIILNNKGKLEMFALDGLKMQGDNITGKKFNQIHADDYLAMIINMYDNPTAKDNKLELEVGVYAPIIPAEKGLSFGFTGIKISVNKIDNKIPADSQIVKEFQQLFFNELARIRQVMIDIKTLPTDKLINNVHLGKKLGLQFNLPNAITPKLKAKLDAFLQTTLDQTIAKGINPSEYLRGMLSNVSDEKIAKLMEEINTSIMVNLESIEQSHIALALESDVIQIKEGKLVSDKLSTDNVEKLIREWALNSTLFNVSQSLLINGDPAFYKGAEDNGKRFYQGFSMLKFADTTTIDDSYKYLKGGKMKINVIADVKESTRSTQDLADIAKDNNLPKVQELAEAHYNQREEDGKIVNPLNATDAQLFVSVGVYAELKRLFGVSSQELTEGFSNADLADALNNVPKSQQGILDIIKPFFYGVQWNEEYQRYVPIQVKCSIFPLSNKYVANNPLLAEHKALMDADENYPQVIAFESSMKAMLPNRVKIENIGETSIVELDLNNFGEQVANPDHMLDSSNSSLRQMKMLMYGMVQEKDANGKDLMYGDKTGRQIKDEIAMLDKANIEEALGKVVSAFEGNNKEFNEFIQNAITSRNSTSIIEAVFEQKPDGTFSYPLDLINSKATIQLISSVFSKRVVRQEFKGGAAVQVSSVGLQIAPKQSDYKTAKAFQEAVEASPELSKLQTSLNWVRKGEVDPKTGKVSSIDFIEAYAPAHAREFINPDGSFKDNIPDELKQMLIYRIPYEGAHSSMVIRVVGFLPAEYKGAMLLPYEVTQQFGADFDFDKIYFIVKDFVMSKDGKFKIFKYIDGTSEQNVLDRYKALINHVLKNDKNARDLVKQANKEIEEFDYTLDYNDKIQVLLDNNIIPFPEDFAKLSVADQNIKPARDNKILDNYMQILRSVNMLESLITPSGPGAIADVYENVEESEDHGNYFTPGHQVYLKDLFHKISMLKGVSALQVTGHAWATEGNLEIKPITIKENGESIVIERGVKVFSKNEEGKNETQIKKNLSKVISDSGNKIVEELSSMMAVILDAVKSPNQLPSIGISMKTLPIWSYLVRLGFGSRTASQFTSQQAIKDLSAALENNDKQLKSKDFVKQDVNTVRAEYIQKYQEAYDALYAENKFNEGNSINSRKIVEYLEKNDSEKIGKYNTLSLKDLEKYSTLNPEELAKKKLKQPYKSLSQQNEELTGTDKLNYLKSQIVALNVFKDSEDVIKELGELNQLFSINKETGPNFEDVNSKKASKESLIKDDTAISGIGQLLNSDAIKPYIDTIDAQFEIMAKHYNFASPFFNNIKDELAKMQYGNRSNLTRIPAEDREVINGFIQMFLDAEETFDNIYTDENRIPEEDFINDLKVLLSKKISTSYKYKIFGDKVLTAKAQEQLKSTALLQSLEVVSIKNSNQNYVALKGNRYELAQKEMMIDELVRLYNSKYKEFAVRLIEQAFKDTGFFSGLHAYSGLIHPSILQDMGLIEARAKIREMVKSESTNKGRMARIIDQLVRNNAKKFTRVYDNNQKLFTEIEEGKTIIVDMNSKDSRLKTELNRPGEDNKHPMYIRYTLNDTFTPIYKLDVEATEESGQITYRQVSYLGSPAKKIEINPNSDEVKTKFPNNEYEKFVDKDKTKTTNGRSEADLAAEFLSDDELTSVPETSEVETNSDSENITDGQAEIKPEGSILSAQDLADEWGDEEFEEETTESTTSVESKELTQEEADWLANNIKLITRTYKVFSIHDAIDTELKNPIIIGETKVTNIDPDVSEKPYIIFERSSGRWMVKIEEKKGNLFTRLYKWADYNKKGEFSFYVSEDSSANDKANIEKAGLNPLIQQLYTDTNIKDPGTRLGQFEAANALQQKYNIKRTFKDIINELKNNISPSQEKSVSSTIINPEITQNKPDGLPGIDRSPESCS